MRSFRFQISLFRFRISKVAALKVVVDEAHRLHEGVAGGGTDEGPAPFFEVPAEGGGFGGGGEGLGFGPGEGFRARGGLELPDVGVEVGKFLEEFEDALGVVDGGPDLAAMADDAGIPEEAGKVGVGETGDLMKVETGKGGPKIFPFAEDGEPGETGLESLEAEFFKEAGVVRDHPPPFFVVVAEVFGVGATPPAARFAVGAGDKAVWGRSHGREDVGRGLIPQRPNAPTPGVEEEEEEEEEKSPRRITPGAFFGGGDRFRCHRR